MLERPGGAGGKAMQEITIQGRTVVTDGSLIDKAAAQNAAGGLLPIEVLVQAGMLFEVGGRLYTPRAAFAARVGPFLPD